MQTCKYPVSSLEEIHLHVSHIYGIDLSKQLPLYSAFIANITISRPMPCRASADTDSLQYVADPLWFYSRAQKSFGSYGHARPRCIVPDVVITLARTHRAKGGFFVHDFESASAQQDYISDLKSK